MRNGKEKKRKKLFSLACLKSELCLLKMPVLGNITVAVELLLNTQMNLTKQSEIMKEELKVGILPSVIRSRDNCLREKNTETFMEVSEITFSSVTVMPSKENVWIRL